jgi:hypothetical protein
MKPIKITDTDARAAYADARAAYAAAERAQINKPEGQS